MGLVELCVNVSSPIIECPITFPFQVSLTTRGRTAGNAIYNLHSLFFNAYLYHNIIVSPMDYGALCTILAFAACETRQCVNMTIVDDFEVEPNEDFLYTLERAPGLNSDIRLNPVEGEVIIFDNDGT